MISGKLVRAKARILGVATAALALSAIAVPATAQTYPSRSITILVGYSAGGQADALARIIGKQLGENLKVSVVIENKTGANGMIAAQAAARAEPDGYTILMVTDAMVTIDPAPRHQQSVRPFEGDGAGRQRLMVAAAACRGQQCAGEFGGRARRAGQAKDAEFEFRQPGQLDAAPPRRRDAAEIRRLHHDPHSLQGNVGCRERSPGRADPDAVRRTHGGGAAGEAGKIKVLGVTSEKRYPLLPNVPAISETFPQFKIISYIGFMLPRNTPKPVIASLNKEVNQVLATDSMRVWLDKQGMVAVGGTPDDFKRQIEVDYQARGELVRELGITAE